MRKRRRSIKAAAAAPRLVTPQARTFSAARSMLAAMIHLVREGRLKTDGEPGPESEYRLAARDQMLRR